MPMNPKSNSILQSLRGLAAAFLRGTGSGACRRAPMLVEEVEPRILHSADLVPELRGFAAAVPQQVESRLLDAGSRSVPAIAHIAQATPHELVIVDTATPDYQKLVDAIQPQSSDRQIEVVLLDSHRDGIQQITDILSARKDISAVHIISHGADGIVQLGSGNLNLDSLPKNATQIKSWGNALAPGADILIYGCDVAQKADGKALVDALSRLTGAVVAASENLTGNARLGGDWNLEYTTGAIQAADPFIASLEANWQGTLALVEKNNTWAPTIARSWQVTTLSGGPFNVPANAVLEIAISNIDSGGGQAGGVRAVGSALNRSFSISKQQVGTESIEMLVQANASGQIETFASSTTKITYTLLGYWDSGTYVETSGSFTVGANATWTTQGLSAFGVTPGSVAEVVIANNTNNSPQVGVRTEGSSFNRTVDIRNQAGGSAPEKMTMLVKAGATASANIQAYTQSDDTNVTFNVVGYWSTPPGNYIETFANLAAPSANSTWETKNLSANGVTAGAVVDILFTNEQPNTTNSAGIRNVGSANPRLLALNSFGAGATGGPDNAQMLATTTNDANSSIQWYHDNVAAANFYLLGYFGNTAPTNTAPTLSGANNLTTINEDPSSNPGTLVSALISGKVTDADPGALTGIAVTAVNNTNGSWEYSVDGGASWTAFGTPSVASARLLAADATSTYVRFVPNAAYNGTVTNGLTFRAWDQTSGVNGTAVNTSSVTNTVLDRFSTVSYTNNDGTATWSAGWVDTDGNPSAGGIQITGGHLVLSTLIGTDSIYREANLSGATSATLSFSYNNLVGLLGTVSLQASNNGGGSYTTLATFSSASNTGSGTFSTDISAYIAGNTRIQLVMNGVLLGGSLTVDDVQISYVTPLNGGSTAFSAATASSSITVNRVNDAPVGTNNTVTTAEDAPYVFRAADFGFSDPLDTPPNALLAVKLTTLPGAGALRLNGIALTSGQFVSSTDIAAGNLVFTPAANATGAGYASFTFQVQDNGGSAAGGVDLDPTPRTMSINVTAVNDAPVGANNTVTTAENAPYVFRATDFGFSDPLDTPPNALLAVKLTTLPGAGALRLSGVALTSGQFVSSTDIAAGNLVFTPAATGAGYASFTFQVQDNGGSAAGGVDLDPTPRTMSINVTAVNDAPVNSAPAAQTTTQDTVLVFSAANGNSISIGDVDAGASSVQVMLSASNGKLTLTGTTGLAFTLGTGNGDAAMRFTGTIANINAALNGLQFAPSPGYTGAASLSIDTDDLGNTGTGGALTASSVVGINVAAAAVPFITPVTPVTSVVPTPAASYSVVPPSPAAPVISPASTPGGSSSSGVSTFMDVRAAGGSMATDSPVLAVGTASTAGSNRGALYVVGPSSLSNPSLFRTSYTLPAAQLLMFGDAASAVTDVSVGSPLNINIGGTTSNALQSPALITAMDQLREGLQEQSHTDAQIVASTAAASLGLSVGYVLWLLRGGLLVGSLLSSLPAWRLVDPLPILSRLDDDEDNDEDDSLESMVAVDDTAPAPSDLAPGGKTDSADAKSVA